MSSFGVPVNEMAASFWSASSSAGALLHAAMGSTAARATTPRRRRNSELMPLPSHNVCRPRIPLFPRSQDLLTAFLDAKGVERSGSGTATAARPERPQRQRHGGGRGEARGATPDAAPAV